MDSRKLFNKMRALPKVDLHRHLEGSILPNTLIKIAEKYGGKLPTYDIDKLRPLIQVNNDSPCFNNFLSKFKVFKGFYTVMEAVEEVAFNAVKEAAEDNVKYLELRYSPTHFASNGRFKESEVIKCINSSIQQAAREYNIVVIAILTISRDYGVELARQTVELVAEMKPGFFYGLDIAGDEVNNSAKPFAGLFDIARKSGLGITVHAGEACGASNVREAVVDFRADRIGHGIQSVEDETVMKMLSRKNIMLEVCLSSNFYTGVVSSIKAHP